MKHKSSSFGQFMPATHTTRSNLSINDNDESVLWTDKVVGVCKPDNVENDNNDDENNGESKLLLVTPNPDELTTSVLATNGNIVFLPSAVDFARGEGLWEMLAPVMETILSNGNKMTSTAKLTVVLLKANDNAKQKFLDSAESVLANLIIHNNNNDNVMTLKDVFGQGVEFLTLQQASTSGVFGSSSTVTDNGESTTTYSSLVNTMSCLTPAEMASANTGLFSKTRAIVKDCIETVQRQAMAIDNNDIDNDDNDNMILVPEFGQLCSLAVQSAKDQFNEISSDSKNAFTKSLESLMLQDLSLRFQSMMQQ
mmetsp:Transcript_17475/g.22679  ORF Transcript_17475/g.22679 Transcript_17475/m.22679 type:complete len:310 (-) Transcript_17475:501-1430(-)